MWGDGGDKKERITLCTVDTTNKIISHFYHGFCNMVFTRIRANAQAANARMMILQQPGPTSFIVQPAEASTTTTSTSSTTTTTKPKKYKVSFGGRSVCNCPDHRKDQELCIHILWVLLKKFRVPRGNPLLYQLALVEREVMQLLRGPCPSCFFFWLLLSWLIRGHWYDAPTPQTAHSNR